MGPFSVYPEPTGNLSLSCKEMEQNHEVHMQLGWEVRTKIKHTGFR